MENESIERFFQITEESLINTVQKNLDVLVKNDDYSHFSESSIVFLNYVKVKVHLGYIPISQQLVTPNHWLMTQRMNMC